MPPPAVPFLPLWPFHPRPSPAPYCQARRDNGDRDTGVEPQARTHFALVRARLHPLQAGSAISPFVPLRRRLANPSTTSIKSGKQRKSTEIGEEVMDFSSDPNFPSTDVPKEEIALKGGKEASTKPLTGGGKEVGRQNERAHSHDPQNRPHHSTESANSPITRLGRSSSPLSPRLLARPLRHHRQRTKSSHRFPRRLLRRLCSPTSSSHRSRRLSPPTSVVTTVDKVSVQYHLHSCMESHRCNE